MGDILQNISIIVACLTAVYGIVSWRKEHIGKRRIDLAEEVLCSVYEIKDVMRNIRSPFGYVGEGSTRKRASHESSEEGQILDNAYVVYERYDKHKDVFSNFHKLKYRYMANFGKKAEDPFKIVHAAVSEIFVAARMLGTVYWQHQGRRPMSEEQLSKHLEEMHKNERVFWEINADDDINNRIDSAIRICEDICKSTNSLGVRNFVKKYRKGNLSSASS